MKLIIDIPDMIYNILNGDSSWKGLSVDYILNAVKDGTPLEAQPTDAEREAYIKGYDYGVKDWFKSKTQPTNVVDRDAVINLVKYSLCDLKRDADKQIFVNTINSLPSVTPRTNLAETSQDCISILNRIMEYTYGMLTAEKIGLQHLIKSMMDELSGGDSE
jgi:hypothetical protein